MTFLCFYSKQNEFFWIRLSLLSTLLTLHMNSTYLALKHIGGHACTSLIWTDICGIAAGKSCEKNSTTQQLPPVAWGTCTHCTVYSYLNLTREIDPSKLQTIELIMLWIQTSIPIKCHCLGRIFST